MQLLSPTFSPPVLFHATCPPEYGSIPIESLSYTTIQQVTPTLRYINMPPSGQGRSSTNVTERYFYNEWGDVTHDIFIKSSMIRCLTGEKLKRLCESIFLEKFYKNNNVYHIQQRYFIFERNGLPIYWIDSFRGLWGEDMASLWAYHYRRSYCHAVEYIFAYLLQHEKSADFRCDDEKGYWKAELTPLALDLYIPWESYAPITVFGAQIYNYFRNGILVGSACSIPHHTYGELKVFFTLMRHTKTREVRWFPLHPAGTDLYFQEDVEGAMGNDLVFLPDEAWAFKESDRWGKKSINGTSYFSNPVPIACPGGIKQLPAMNVSMATGKHVHILLPNELQADEQLMAELEKKFDESNATSLTFYSGPKRIFKRKNSQRNNVLRHIIFSVAKEILVISSDTGITPPGDLIPGSDIKRQDILSPIIESGQVVWLYGPEKSGKSYFARSLAHIISYGGQFLKKYQAASNLNVLYIDSEMAPDKLEQAFTKELTGLGYTEDRKFAVKAAKASDNSTGEINLLEPEWQEWFNKVVAEYDIIILDCYYSLTRSSVMAKELLQLINPWKSKGKTFIVVDHTNKEGELYGSVDKKRSADLCVEVTPAGNDCIEISFPVARYLGSDDTQPFMLRRVHTDTQFFFEMVESRASSDNITLPEEMLRKTLAYVCVKNRGCKPEEVGEWLNYSKSSIYSWCTEIEEHIDGTAMDNQCYLKTIQEYGSLTLDDLQKRAATLRKQS